MKKRPYYEAYDKRYRIAHEKGICWLGEEPSAIVLQALERWAVPRESSILELGCGEGRDARALLRRGFDLLATDVSPEAIRFCRERSPQWKDRFQVLDCVAGTLEKRFRFIYAVAVVHMLVTDRDRDAFYRFVAAHLTEGGVGLICSMGNGTTQRQTDPTEAFRMRYRDYGEEKIRLPATSCRMVSFPVFRDELRRNGLLRLEEGMTAVSGFSDMMYAVVGRANR